MDELPDLTGLTHEEKDALIHALWRMVLALRRNMAGLKAEVEALRGRLAKTSRNSSTPPSAEGLRKPKSLRKTGERPPGRKPGRQGETLKRAAHPDHVVEQPLPSHCAACGAPLPGGEAIEARQVFDLPPVHAEVTEHRILEARCACGKVHRSAFPANVTVPAQYGANVKALAVYLTQRHMLPIQRTTQVFRDLVGLPLSGGTVLHMIHAAEQVLGPTATRIGEAVMAAPVVGADETGLRVAGKRHWLHTAVTGTLTWVGLHTRRGQAAFEAFGLLPSFTGPLVHDGWAPYRELSCAHALCNAHHLRELTLVHEVGKQPWAGQMIDLLVAAQRETVAAAGQSLPQERTQAIRAEYGALLTAGETAKPPAPPSGQRGRTRQSFPVNLLRRLRDHADDVLRFTADPLVPFSNNLAEQAVCMPKVKQKVAGCFRTLAGAMAFCTIRSYLATLHKQRFDLFLFLAQAFQGDVPQPRFAT